MDPRTSLIIFFSGVGGIGCLGALLAFVIIRSVRREQEKEASEKNNTRIQSTDAEPETSAIVPVSPSQMPLISTLGHREIFLSPELTSDSEELETPDAHTLTEVAMTDELTKGAAKVAEAKDGTKVVVEHRNWWSKLISTSGYREIFISPELTSASVTHTLAAVAMTDAVIKGAVKIAEAKDGTQVVVFVDTDGKVVVSSSNFPVKLRKVRGYGVQHRNWWSKQQYMGVKTNMPVPKRNTPK